MTGDRRREYFRLTHAYLDADATAARPVRPRFVAELTRRLRPDDVVAELGCGAGVPVAREVSERARVIGVDRVADRLDRARRAVPAALFVRADFTRLGFRAESLAGVIAFYSLIHAPAARLPSLFANLRGWLRPGGLFVGVLGTHCSAFAGAVPPDVSCPSEETLLAELVGAGLAVVETRSAGLTTPDGAIEFLWFAVGAPGVPP